MSLHSYWRRRVVIRRFHQLHLNQLVHWHVTSWINNSGMQLHDEPPFPACKLKASGLKKVLTFAMPKVYLLSDDPDNRFVDTLTCLACREMFEFGGYK